MHQRIIKKSGMQLSPTNYSDLHYIYLIKHVHYSYPQNVGTLLDFVWDIGGKDT